MYALLDNIAWESLTGEHTQFALGTSDARRYGPGFSPILGFTNPEKPNFDGLIPFCKPGEQFYAGGWSGPEPDGWRVTLDSTMFQLVWEGDTPDREDAPEALPLTAEHAAQALALAELTHPGPFGIRTIELGEYFGIFEGPRLVSMAGERLCAGSLREISGVCTHPDFQGQGLARRLMRKLIYRQMRRGEIPFLHVMSANNHARGMYERMGFRCYRERVIRVVARV